MNEYHVKPRQNGKTLELLRKVDEQVSDRDSRECEIMAKYIPTYNAFVRYMYENGKSEWNPDEHEDWELPPSELLVTFFELFPVIDGKETVINKITPSMAKRIEETTEK